MGTMWDNVVALVRTINAKSKDLSWGQSTISSVKIIFDVDFDVNAVADVGADANKSFMDDSQKLNQVVLIFFLLSKFS